MTDGVDFGVTVASGTFADARGDSEVLFCIAVIPTMGKLGVFILELAVKGFATRVVNRSRAAASLLGSGRRFQGPISCPLLPVP